MSTHVNQEKARPVVMIAGAGLGGLLLAILLEQINIPYHIFERSKELRTFGGLMTLGASILPVFEQLGLLEDLMKLSKVYKCMKVYGADMTELVNYERTFLKEVLGYHNILFAKPKLYELLLKQVPADKISLNKKVLNIKEENGRVIIQCSDSTSYEGDILIGADGSYSGVRQSLYKSLDEQGLLPKADLEEFSIAYTLMVGVADTKDPEKYPELNEPYVTLAAVIGGNYRTLSQNDSKSQHFRNSEWGPESNDTMIKKFQDCISPLGGTMGNHINDTPKDLISKVYLEEKLFKTWHHGRTVLIGDAAHKMHPAAGLGAVNAFQDAVILANCLYEMKDNSLQSITSAFKEYYTQRYDHVQAQCNRSHRLAKAIFGQTLIERVMRHIMFKYMPASLVNRAAVKSLEYHPKIAWLPPAKNTSSVPHDENKNGN
ncbi:hypothetical protein BGX27_009142 [Mortierella sp. AM989]|nr:hypothetical protein BGX27_009142 [Mortierella sp. AM989]